MTAEKLRSITREEFLIEREQNVAAAKRIAGLCLNTVHVDPGSLVLCDFCNSSINDHLLWFNDHGIYCATCREQRGLI